MPYDFVGYNAVDSFFEILLLNISLALLLVATYFPFWNYGHSVFSRLGQMFLLIVVSAVFFVVYHVLWTFQVFRIYTSLATYARETLNSKGFASFLDILLPFVLLVPAIIIVLILWRLYRSKYKQELKQGLYLLGLYAIVFTIIQGVVWRIWLIYYGYDLHVMSVGICAETDLCFLAINAIIAFSWFIAYVIYLNIMYRKRHLDNEAQQNITYHNTKFLSLFTFLIAIVGIGIGFNVVGHITDSYCYYFNTCHSCGDEFYKRWCIKHGELYLEDRSGLEEFFNGRVPLPDNMQVKKLIRPIFLHGKDGNFKGDIVIEDRQGKRYRVYAEYDFDKKQWSFTVEPVEKKVRSW